MECYCLTKVFVLLFLECMFLVESQFEFFKNFFLALKIFKNNLCNNYLEEFEVFKRTFTLTR